MAPLLQITVVQRNGTVILRGTWPGTAIVDRVYKAVQALRSGYRCHLLLGAKHLRPHVVLASLSLLPETTLQVEWLLDSELYTQLHIVPRFGFASIAEPCMHSGVVPEVRSWGAFAAIKYDGSVVTWGRGWHGGDSSAVALHLSSGVVSICGNLGAMAAIKSDGSVVTW